MSFSTALARRPWRLLQSGFTLVEALMALSVLACLLSVAVPPLQRLLDSRRVERLAGELAADLRWARAEALSRQQALRVSFDAAGPEGCYVVHTGAVCACLAATAPCGQALKTVRWQLADAARIESNVRSLLFHPLLGTATPAASVTTLGLHGSSVRHVVNLMGRVRSCSPGGSGAGGLAC